MDHCASRYCHVNYYSANTTNQYEYCEENLTIVHSFNTVFISDKIMERTEINHEYSRL